MSSGNVVAPKRRDQRSRSLIGSAWSRISGYIFLAPGLGGLAIFFLFPLLFAFVMSLMTISLVNPDNAAWTGINNYREIFGDPTFVRSLWNTILYAIIQTPLQTILGLSLALLVKKRLAGIGLFRTLYYLPVVISMVVASVIWRIAYAPEGGLINAFLNFVGIDSQPFLTSTFQALPSVAGMLAWKWVGFSMIIFLAGLQNIPEDMYEAARLDGAGRWKQFLNVTLPLLKRTMLFVVVVNTINSFKLFTPIMLITQGGPNDSTTVLVYYIYKEAFQYFNLGTASAGAVILFGIILMVLIAQFRLFQSDVEY